MLSHVIRTVTPSPSQKIRVRETSQEAAANDSGVIMAGARLGGVGVQRKTNKAAVTDATDRFDTGFQGEQRSVKELTGF